MKIKNRDGCTCVGALRLASIDVGFDLRATGAEVQLPPEADTAAWERLRRDGIGYDDASNNRRLLVDATPTEARDVLRVAGYAVQEVEK